VRRVEFPEDFLVTMFRADRFKRVGRHQNSSRRRPTWRRSVKVRNPAITERKETCSHSERPVADSRPVSSVPRRKTGFLFTFSSGIATGVQAPFKLVGDVYDAATGQIAIDGISDLTGWERDAAVADTAGGASGSWFTAPTAGSDPAVALLGKYQDIKDYIAVAPPGIFDADFLNFQGTMKNGTAGVGSWNWTRNKQYIDDALAAGKEVRLVTDPNTPIYKRGNVYQRELKYLKDNGYEWIPVDDYWVVVRVRP
jgi:hypothetical protein